LLKIFEDYDKLNKVLAIFLEALRLYRKLDMLYLLYDPEMNSSGVHDDAPSI
jgi:hypothetical protein